MARLDDLVEHIGDTQLRDQIQGAIADLKAKKRFGLVFEEHVPETSTLSRLAPVVGNTVEVRTEKAGPLYRVSALESGIATLDPLQSGQTRNVPLNDLLVVKRFAEPMYPALMPLGSIKRGANDAPWHAVINGENFQALRLLEYTCAGQVDCIYIDPPYNSGARDWTYNNRYVDRKDAWRHSKWLSFMDKRLRIAQRLLRPDGVLIVTIDENEVHHLGMLLERRFPEYLRHMVTMVINPKGTGKLNFARVDEYAIYCVPNTGASVIKGVPIGRAAALPEAPLLNVPDTLETLFEEEEGVADVAANEADEADTNDEEESDEAHIEGQEGPLEALPFPASERDEWEARHARRRGSESSYRHQRPNQFYPIYIDIAQKRVVRTAEAPPLEQGPDFSEVDGLHPIWPIDSEGNERCWRFIPPSMQLLIDAGRVFLGRYNKKQDTWTLNIWERRPASKKLKTVWWETPHDAGTHGTTLLHKLLGRRGAFAFPKSLYAVRDCLAAVVRDRPEALIVDFFAGSGTTFHATCLLNAADGGRRRTIQITNNEVSEKVARALHKKGLWRGDSEYEAAGVFEAVTRPRCQAVVMGERPDGASLKGTYLGGRPMANGFEENLEFFRLEYLDRDEVDLGTQLATLQPVLWLGSGSVGERESPEARGDWLMPERARYAVLLRDTKFRSFLRALKNRPDIGIVYFVTDSEEAYAEMCDELPRSLHTQMLFRDYLRFFSRPEERAL